MKLAHEQQNIRIQHIICTHLKLNYIQNHSIETPYEITSDSRFTLMII